ncbi:precorrin-3B C(17)-methyltransferase [Magnetovibrio sp.]|uniref:precorrin-3B C(17)-methyltransferase n=1 Tax=Magnetovibrio sp. TaxID=2024836 RepID=UPI002F92196C
MIKNNKVNAQASEVHPGKLIGIGIGPGAADLMTVRARAKLAQAQVIAHMHASGKAPLALEIVQPFVPTGVDVLAVAVPMDASGADRQVYYDHAIPEFRAHLEQGRDVTFICEGDALFYGSFQYVMERLIDDYEIEVVPGVTSVQACSAAATLPLTRGDDTFQALPATLPEGVLTARLRDPRCAVAVMKIGRHVSKVKRALLSAGRLDDAMWIERASTTEQKIAKFADFEGDSSYFSMILVPACKMNHAADAPQNATVVCLNKAGLATAQRLKAGLPGAKVWGRTERLEPSSVDQLFADSAETLRDLYRSGTPIVAVMSAGIVMRVLAPLLADKYKEPPVVAVSPDGAFAVPLLGGHHGANHLAAAIAGITHGQAAITTAGDAHLGVALDEPPHGWSVANPQRAKSIATSLLNGDKVGLDVESGDASWLAPAGFRECGALNVRVTHMAAADKEEALVLHPPTLALGVGCERDCDPVELSALVDETLAAAGLAKQSIACVASIDVKSDEAAVLHLADELGVPARFFTAAELEAQTPKLKNPSDVVFAEVGCHGVSEGAALAAASGGELIVAKHKSKRATCAVALDERGIKPAEVGKGRGRLFVVGIGPGTDAWRTPEVTRVISQVTDVVGYGFYLDLIPDLIKGKVRHTSILSEEEARVRQALELAAEGRDVALISSGDIGIYAMASLVFELLDREDRADWNRLYIQVEPGISAFQAAAARIGAPVGHDFCLISLSDLLTPWNVIERRLKAAAEGGFVVSFYNPVSKRRRTQLAEARDILLSKRSSDTPVVLARQLGRPDEKIDVIRLGDLTPDHADMLTLVMVGGEDTRVIERGQNCWVYTPRGYGGKMDAQAGGND